MAFPDYEIISLEGLRSFQEVYDLQLEILAKRIQDQIPDTFIVCEHLPVITRGRGLQFQEKRKEKAKPLTEIPSSTDYIEIERGGDLTWHGPGQLVVYPIVKLGGDSRIGKLIGQDIDRWIRFLENVWINILTDFQVEAHSKAGGSGVWLQTQFDGGLVGEQKVMSVGIALRRWVSYHGIAVNIVNDLTPFFSFDPCGYQAEVMTRLKDLKGIPADCFTPNWRNLWEKRFFQSVNNLIA